MQNRISMNSKSLQEAFPEVYRDFFSKCPIVVSAPASFIWSGEYASIFGGFSINQLLPARIYIGLTPVSFEEITSGTYKVFNPSLQRFEDHVHNSFIRNKIITLMKKEIAKITKKDKNNGFILHVLSEAPLERGLNISGATAAALSLGFNLLYRCDLGCQDVKNWETLTLPELINEKMFDRVFRLSWKLESIYHAGVASGRGAFVPFVWSFYPIIFFAAARARDNSKEKFPITTNGEYEILETIKYQSFRLNEFFELNVPDYWPIDFGLIYSGYENSTASVARMIPHVQAELEKTAQKIKKQLDEKLANVKDKNVFTFYDYCSGDKKEELWGSVIRTLGTVSLQIVNSFENLIRLGHSEKYLHDFFKALNHYQNLLHILEASTTVIDNICFSIHDKARKLNIFSGVGTKLTGVGHGGDVVFSAPIGIFRKSAEELILELKESFNKEITLDYASWIDGYAEEGIKVEQCLEEKIYSSFISQGAAKVTHLNRAGYLHEDLYTLEDYEKMRKTADILLDGINRDIYVRGQRLTSKEIHSTAATVGIMRILLNNLGKNVKNSQFPVSSYTKDRNELQGKILSPLIKAVQKKTGYKLNLELHGGLIEFFIKLESSDLDIFLLEKIF